MAFLGGSGHVNNLTKLSDASRLSVFPLKIGRIRADTHLKGEIEEGFQFQELPSPAESKSLVSIPMIYK